MIYLLILGLILLLITLRSLYKSGDMGLYIETNVVKGTMKAWYKGHIIKSVNFSAYEDITDIQIKKHDLSVECRKYIVKIKKIEKSL